MLLKSSLKLGLQGNVDARRGLPDLGVLARAAASGVLVVWRWVGEAAQSAVV